MPERNERVMAFDYGIRWIGVAVGQAMLGTGTAVARFQARDGIPRWEEVDSLLQEWQPQRLVVGLPLNMDGSESDMSLRARKFSRRLDSRFRGPVSLIDERLTSYAAKRDHEARGRALDYSREGAGVDGEAAVIILEDWFRSACADGSRTDSTTGQAG
ncbi:MAG: Holliday junction resolvase RuvX [Alteromonadaceae bacterium]|nr:Holliday junction resolvase RuvX [Alteromonadaceae bacterium]